MSATGFASSPLFVAAVLSTIAIVASGCQTTADRSAELEKQAGSVIADQKGVVVSKQSRDIDVTDTTVLSDDYGTAAIVELKNTSEKNIANPPITVTIPGSGKEPLYTNDEPGLDPALTSIALIQKDESAFWVNDQIPLLAEKPKKTEAIIGKGEQVSGEIPEIRIGKTEFFADNDGASLRGIVLNKSKILQTKLVVYGIARKGGKIIGAGTGQVERLAPGRRAGFQLFLIGKYKSAEYEFYAPPTVLK